MTPLDVSEQFIERLRDIRKTCCITGEQLAKGLTEHGHPITRSVISNMENGRFKTVSIDLVMAAMSFLQRDLPTLLYGPLCTNCNDNPPQLFACRICNRYWEKGKLVRC
jgi:transcriptional regulator with XRE-family HTH domain